MSTEYIVMEYIYIFFNEKHYIMSGMSGLRMFDFCLKIWKNFVIKESEKQLCT